MITGAIVAITFAIAALVARSGSTAARQRCAVHLLAVSAAVTIFVMVRAAAGTLAQCSFELSGGTAALSPQVRR
jgi:hypothetical protein